MSKVTVVLCKAHIIHSIRDRKLTDDRIDIVHQCLLALLDSPLNKSNHLKIYISTVDNTLIEINPKLKIPRSIHRFRGLLPALFEKRKIKTEDNEILLRIIKNPIDEHLPPDSLRIGLSQQGVKLDKKLISLNAERDFVVFLNANQSGKDEFPDPEVTIKISDFPLSAFVCCTKICTVFEDFFDIF